MPQQTAWHALFAYRVLKETQPPIPSGTDNKYTGYVMLALLPSAWSDGMSASHTEGPTLSVSSGNKWLHNAPAAVPPAHACQPDATWRTSDRESSPHSDCPDLKGKRFALSELVGLCHRHITGHFRLKSLSSHMTHITCLDTSR